MFWAGHGRHLDVGDGEGRGAVRVVGDTLQGAPGVCPPRGLEAGQDVSASREAGGRPAFRRCRPPEEAGLDPN